MHLVEIFLPLTDPDGQRFGLERYGAILKEMTDRFGGVTAFNRAPAQGTFWDGTSVEHDDLVIFEVMAATLDRAWWKSYRQTLERSFNQDEILIRVTPVEKL